jgi:hypothetical protein
MTGTCDPEGGAPEGGASVIFRSATNGRAGKVNVGVP